MRFWVDKEQEKSQMANGKMHMFFRLIENNIVRYLQI